MKAQRGVGRVDGDGSGRHCVTEEDEGRARLRGEAAEWWPERACKYIYVDWSDVR